MELENQILDLSGFTNYPVRLLRDYIEVDYERLFEAFGPLRFGAR